MGRVRFRTVGFISDCKTKTNQFAAKSVHDRISCSTSTSSSNLWVSLLLSWILKCVTVLKNVGSKLDLRSTYQKCILFCVKRTKVFLESNTSQKCIKSKRNFCEKKGWDLEYHITVICVTDTYSFWKQSKINYDEL